MSEEQRKDLLLFYLNTLADIYGELATSREKSSHPFDKQTVSEAQHRKQEVLHLRASIQTLLESRIAQKLSQQLQSQWGSSQIEDRRKDSEILETVQRGLRILTKRWEDKGHVLQAKVVRAMSDLASVPFGGLVDAKD
jgi:hypothetical protein